MGTDQKRDADTDRLLRALLKPASAAGPGGCPDAAMLAAFVEGSLSPGEQSALDTHIAGCGRCQEALAIMALDKQPEEEAAPAAGWFTWVARPRLRWLVPITAAATLAVVVLVSRTLIAPDQFPADVNRMAQAPSETAQAPLVERGLERDKAAEKAPPAKEPAKSSLRLEAPMRRANEVGASKQAAEAAPAPAVVGQADFGKKTVAEAVAESAGRAAADEKRTRAAAEPAGAPADAPLAAVPAAPPSAPLPAASDISPKAAASPNRPSADAARAAVPVGMPKREDLRILEPVTTVLGAPDGTVRWRLGPGGRIWRSVDAGSTWHSQPSGVSANLVSGSAPSATTCWAVGASGTVLLTQDGEHWTLIPFPLAADLAAVQASNARVATVTTRDGRRFETLDAGRTWSLR